MIDNWYSVCCNDCFLTAETLPLPSEAWRSAEKEGFTREAIPDSRKFKHYCRECSAKRATAVDDSASLVALTAEALLAA